MRFGRFCKREFTGQLVDILGVTIRVSNDLPLSLVFNYDSPLGLTFNHTNLNVKIASFINDRFDPISQKTIVVRLVTDGDQKR